MGIFGWKHILSTPAWLYMYMYVVSVDLQQDTQIGETYRNIQFF